MDNPRGDGLGQARAAINEAALDTARWPEALGCIAAAAGSNGAAIFTLDPASDPLAQGFGTATDGIREYMDRWSDADPWFKVVVAKQTLWDAGYVEFGPVMVPEPQLRRTAFHCDFLRRYAIEHLVSLKVASGVSAGSVGTHLSLYRPAHRCDFGSAEREVLRALWPAVRRAVDVHSLLSRGGLMRVEQAAEASLDAMPLPAWVVGDRAFVHFQNRAAARWLAAERGTPTTAYGTLRTIGTLGDADLARAIACASAGSSSALVTALPTASSPRRALLHVTPLPPPLRAVWPRGVALLILKVPSGHAEKGQWLQHLTATYHLTAAEANVLRHLAEGLSPRQAAAALDISYATVRTHLLALYQKTSCRRQAELVRLAS